MTKTFLIMVVLFISSGCNDLSYADSGKDKMIKAIIGEASNQPEEGRIAVACGVKNRPEGLVGVYGANMSRKPSKQEIINA
ncbi:hypothetical protein KAR91_35210, partial [Candidatus Pacearchaeota archaeon]|nr:hypothetical protein [Candidatus Pacearchaeota archaeon]